LIFGTELALIQKEPYLLSTGFINWSPHSHVDPEPFIEAGYYAEQHKFIAGFTQVDFRSEAILGYPYDFNKTWRFPVDWQSGSGNSSTIGFTCNLTRDLLCHERQPSPRPRLYRFHLHVSPLKSEKEPDANTLLLK
jgi:hypothetical protein